MKIVRMNWMVKPFGYNYLGAGNKEDAGAPYNEVDKIAEEHDKFYSRILEVADSFSDEEFRKRVSAADQKAIKDFVANYYTDGHDWNWAALAGAAGLSIKQKTEAILGTIIYPRKPAFSGNG